MTEDTVAAFVATAMDEDGKNWSASTTRSCLSAISEYCLAYGLEDPLRDERFKRRVNAIIEGANRTPHQLEKQRAPRATRLPLTPQHAQDLLRAHSGVIPAEEQYAFPAFLLTAVATLARGGNLLATTQNIDPKRDLTLGRVQVDGERVELSFPSTKTKIQGATATVENTSVQDDDDDELNPYTVLCGYHGWRLETEPRLPTSPYFIRADGSALTKRMATRTLRLLLLENKDDPTRYGLHSTRHGGATALIAAGAGQQEVRLAGGWASSSQAVDAYYNNMAPERASELQRIMMKSGGKFHSKAPTKTGPGRKRGAGGASRPGGSA